MGKLLLGTTLLASFLGAVVAATLVFGAGVATVILPIGLGATALSSLLIDQHMWIFTAGGVLMLLRGREVPLVIAVIAGRGRHRDSLAAASNRAGNHGAHAPSGPGPFQDRLVGPAAVQPEWCANVNVHCRIAECGAVNDDHPRPVDHR